MASIAAALTIFAFSAAGSGAAAQVSAIQGANVQANEPTDISVASAAASGNADAAKPAEQPNVAQNAADDTAPASLAELAARQNTTDELPQQLQCMASAIYFEAGHEKLTGQLAVGRVIVERSRSGRFPDSYCGVVYQRAQFSFVHGHTMPAIKTNSAAWRNSVAMARIAHDGSWHSPAEGAMFFHSVHVSPNWAHRTRVAQIDNHIFYR